MSDKEFYQIAGSLYKHELTDSEFWDELKEKNFIDGKEITAHEGHTLFMLALWTNQYKIAIKIFELGANPFHLNNKGLNVFDSMIKRETRHSFSDIGKYLARFKYKKYLQSSENNKENQESRFEFVKKVLNENISSLNQNEIRNILNVVEYCTYGISAERLSNLKKSDNKTLGGSRIFEEFLALKRKNEILESVEKVLKTKPKKKIKKKVL